MPLLHIEKLSKVYHGVGTTTTAVQDASFAIEEGQFVSIMGPSGSGKSTLLHLIGLLDRPTSGSYFFADQDTSQLSDIQLAHLRNQEIGFVFQAFQLLARTSVLDNVMLPLQYSNTPHHEHRRRAEQAIEQVELSHRVNHTPAQLSGGEKQRVAIARALVNQPRLILADEPTGNLDTNTGQIVMNLIDTLHEQGHTIIVITHETPTAQYAQRIIKMRDGAIVSNEATHRRHRHFTK